MCNGQAVQDGSQRINHTQKNPVLIALSTHRGVSRGLGIGEHGRTPRGGRGLGGRGGVKIDFLKTSF